MKNGIGILGQLVKEGKISQEERQKVTTFLISVSATAFAVGILTGLVISML